MSERSKTVWKMAPGKRAGDWPIFDSGKCIGIGWLPNDDYREFESTDAILERLREVHGDEPGYRLGAAKMIWKFTHVVKKGDIVVANAGHDQVVGIGEITSGYIPPKSRNNPIKTAHTHRKQVRRVNWKIKEDIQIPGNQFFVQATLKELNNQQISALHDACHDLFVDQPALVRKIDRLLLDSQPTSFVANDLLPPASKKVTVTRIIRDTRLATAIKRLHNYECQICGSTIELPDKSRYAEAHHITPLGRDHKGLDEPGNIICLCPNHHAECDLGVIKLAKRRLRTCNGHSVNQENITYHNQSIFGK